MAKKKENTDNKEVLGENKENSAAKTADAGAENGVASAQEKFQIKLRELLALAKKKKNMLEYQEISDFFSDMQLDAEQFEKILDFLEANNIDVLRITDDDVDDEMLLDVDDEDEIEVEKIDLSVPDGVSIEDPVRMYLSEKCRFCPRRRRLSWQSVWSSAIRRRKRDWQRPIFVWLSALQSAMSVVECCFWI